MSRSRYASLDAALDELTGFGPTLKNGNSNHAPMVAEALCALGRPEAVMPWLERYRERMEPRPAPGEPIARDAWREALGRRGRFADWAVLFAAELGEAPWPAVLDRWVARLAAGFCAAATHGPIRVGHAVRGLAERDTPSRRRELADALASWAATWQRLPSADGEGDRTLPPRQAIARVPLVPPERRPPGNIVTRLAVLGAFPEFAPVIGLIDAAGAPGALLAELSELFARVYLANARDIATTIAFIHAVTSHAALGNMVANIGDATTRTALRYAWQAGAALYACYGGTDPVTGNVDLPTADAEALVERAVANGDEHVIKFTEACLNRDAAAPSPVYLAAAEAVHRFIPPRRPG
jgi:hypothetical protein